MTTHYDAIVVGARCAGAPTAMLLARKGYHVLLVDRAIFPSDTLSTHIIHAPGVAALHRWGLLEQIQGSGCPPIKTYSFDFGTVTLNGSPRGQDGINVGYAPRRAVLDTILVDAAQRAGAEVRQAFNVDEVIVDDGVVTGIRGHHKGGRPVVERARVVIGADGRNSHVAKAVEASQYNAVPRLQWGYYSYWSDLPVDGLEVFARPDRTWGAAPTNEGLTMLVVGWPQREASAYRSDPEGNYLKTLELVPRFAERVRAARREAPFLGGAVHNYFRTPYGPGWVLVGDAGYDKDPITAQGITDAFRDSEFCAAALDDTFSGRCTFGDAMAAYHRARDAHVGPMYDFTTQLATLAPPPPEMEQLLGAIAGTSEAMDGFASVVAGTVSPADFFAPENVGRILGAPVG